MRQSAVITIATIGGASVLLEARGSFTDGFLGEVSDRLTCLAALEFPWVTLDLRGIADIDPGGRALISAFAMRIGSTGGRLRTIGPTGRCAGIGNGSRVAIVEESPDRRWQAA